MLCCATGRQLNFLHHGFLRHEGQGVSPRVALTILTTALRGMCSSFQHSLMENSVLAFQVGTMARVRQELPRQRPQRKVVEQVARVTAEQAFQSFEDNLTPKDQLLQPDLIACEEECNKFLKNNTMNWLPCQIFDSLGMAQSMGAAWLNSSVGLP